MILGVEKKKSIPVYKQIIEAIIDKINDGSLKEGDMLPSINKLSDDLNLAKATIVKAFSVLQERGIIKPVHGKGFFIATTDTEKKHNIFLLFDTLTSYKEVLYNSLIKSFGNNATIDIYFHHYNTNIARKLISEANGKYSSYIILLFDCEELPELLDILPQNKVFLLDRNPKIVENKFPGVFQDFFNDINTALDSIKSRINHYQKFVLVFRNTIIQVPTELKKGFEYFCTTNHINFEVIIELDSYNLRKDHAFIVIDDEDLVFLIEESQSIGLEVGKDIGIISYNDTSLKKVISGGISVISTDFAQMGNKIAQMIMNNKPEKVKNICQYINRKSF